MKIHYRKLAPTYKHTNLHHQNGQRPQKPLTTPLAVDKCPAGLPFSYVLYDGHNAMGCSASNPTLVGPSVPHVTTISSTPRFCTSMPRLAVSNTLFGPRRRSAIDDAIFIGRMFFCLVVAAWCRRFGRKSSGDPSFIFRDGGPYRCFVTFRQTRLVLRGKRNDGHRSIRR